MKKNLTRLGALAVSVAMMITAFAGCGSDKDTASSTSTATGSTIASTTSTTSNKPDISKFVTLKSYIIGDPGVIEKEQLENINKQMKEKINAELTLASVSWGDYTTKFPILLASGEPFDTIYSANWINYFGEATKGGYYALDDILDQYGPNLKKGISEAEWNQTRVNDKIYMVPAIGKDFTTHGILVRGDLRKKYNLPEIKTMDDYGVFMEGIKKNEKDLIPLNESSGAALFYLFLYENDWARPSTFANGDQGVLAYDVVNGGKAFDVTQTPEYAAFIKRNRQWAEAGYWSKNILSNKTTSRDAFKSGQTASAVINLGNANDVKQFVAEKKLPYDVEFYPIEGSTAIEKYPVAGNGTSIYRGSENPERALMYIDLMYSDRDFYDANYYGIMGKNYELVGEEYKVPDGVNPSDITLSNIGMGLGNIHFAREKVGGRWDVIAKLEAEYVKTGVLPYYGAFAFDLAPVSGEVANVNNAISTYKYALDWGLVDPDKGLATLQSKMKEAGLEKYLTEVNKQLDVFNAK